MKATILKSIPILLLTILVCTAISCSQPKSEFEQLKQKAEQGDVEAQYELGKCYYEGNGVTMSYTEAAEWFEKPAKQGNADAQYKLGWCYQYGWVVVGTQNYTRAVEWYTLAANQGNEDAKEALNNKDIKEFLETKQKAEQGYAEAQYNWGTYYAIGHGVKKDYNEAVKWYRKSAEQGYAKAQNNLGVYYENGYGVKQSYIAAVKWYTLAANQGYASAQYNLGCCYKDGEGVIRDYTEAAKWFRKALEQGDEYTKERAKERLDELGVSY